MRIINVVERLEKYNRMKLFYCLKWWNCFKKIILIIATTRSCCWFSSDRLESHRQSVTFDISAPLLYKCDIILARVLASSIAECALPTCSIPMYCNAVAKVNFPGYLLCNKKQKWITESNVLFNFTPKLVKGGEIKGFQPNDLRRKCNSISVMHRNDIQKCSYTHTGGYLSNDFPHIENCFNTRIQFVYKEAVLCLTESE